MKALVYFKVKEFGLSNFRNTGLTVLKVSSSYVSVCLLCLRVHLVTSKIFELDDEEHIKWMTHCKLRERFRFLRLNFFDVVFQPINQFSVPLGPGNSENRLNNSSAIYKI